MAATQVGYRTLYSPSGFTLIELLVVIFVLCVIALLVLPSTGSADDVRLEEAGRLLVADLDQARIESLGSAADRCLIVFTASGDGYYLARQSDPSAPMTDAATGRPYRRDYGQGAAAGLSDVTLDPIEIGGDRQLAFTGLGRIDQAADARIIVRYRGRALTIAINASTGEPAFEP